MIKYEHPPTAEQMHVIDMAATGVTLKVVAYAGAAKTSTEVMIAQSLSQKQGIYLAFNKAIADSARKRFPSNIESRTFHSLALQHVPDDLRRKLALPKEPPKQFAARYRLSPMTMHLTNGDPLLVSAPLQAKIIRDTVDRFCRSAQTTIGIVHVPVPDAIQNDDARVLKEVILPFAKRHWDEMRDPASTVPITHDFYLKLWAMSKPTMRQQLILLDEVQDFDGVMLQIMAHQDAQAIYVGDPYQQIYEFRGAINALQRIEAPECRLTQSFRFGYEIADLASGILKLLQELVPVKGVKTIASEIHYSKPSKPFPKDGTKAILCRTNARAIQLLADGLKAGHKVAIEANTKDILEFADGAARLMRGQRTLNPASLSLFETWADVADYSESEVGREIRPLVKLIEEHGPEFLVDVCNRAVPARNADYTITTAHKAKGLEWDYVRVEEDFRFKTDAETGRVTMRDDEMKLLYVAFTRAKRHLEVWPMRENLIGLLKPAKK